MSKEPSPDSGSSSWDDAAPAEPAGADPAEPAGADPAGLLNLRSQVPGFSMALVPAGSPVSMPQFIASIHALLGITQCLLS